MYSSVSQETNQVFSFERNCFFLCLSHRISRFFACRLGSQVSDFPYLAEVSLNSVGSALISTCGLPLLQAVFDHRQYRHFVVSAWVLVLSASIREPADICSVMIGEDVEQAA